MVHHLIPTNILPVVSQRSRVCREVMEERRDISFRLQHVWPGTLDHTPSFLAGEGGPLNWPPSAHAVAGNGGTLNCAPSADAVAGNGWDDPPHLGEGQLGANPTWSDCAPMPSGRTMLE